MIGQLHCNNSAVGKTGVKQVSNILKKLKNGPRPCPNMARKFDIFNFSLKVVIMVFNRKFLVS